MNTNDDTKEQSVEPARLGRRSFLRHAGAGAAAAATLTSVTLPATQSVLAQSVPSGATAIRVLNSFLYRITQAQVAKDRPIPNHTSNGDENRYPNRIGSYSKGLPHNSFGEVDPVAYQSLLNAVNRQRPSDFESIRLGSGRHLTSPQAGLAYDLEGANSHHLAQPPAPRFDSAEEAGEMAELYWMALARDVHFNDYETDSTVAAACADLSTMTDFRGPKQGGQVTPATVFRGFTPGDLVGPWMSQFLWLPVPFGAVTFDQKMQTVDFGVDFMTDFASWLSVQNGQSVFVPQPFDPTPRYIRNLRDLSQWVHVDALYQAYVHACLIMLGQGVPIDPGTPLTRSRTQDGFVEFGGPHVLNLVTEVATRALKAVWYQKWIVHRRLRPEAFGGNVHLTKTGTKPTPVHPDILRSTSLDAVFAQHGTYLLPMVFPEGSPTHPAYGAGHATVGGACTTMLKAFFDETAVIQNPKVANADGTALEDYSGPPLTVLNELNKVAANVGIGRNGAGVHWRSDYTESAKLGEAVAITILQEQQRAHNQPFSWSLTKFDGTRIRIENGQVFNV